MLSVHGDTGKVIGRDYNPFIWRRRSVMRMDYATALECELRRTSLLVLHVMADSVL